MRKQIHFILLMISILLLLGCTQPAATTEVDHTERFLQFHGISQGEVANLSSNTPTLIGSVRKENSYEPRVIVQLFPFVKEPTESYAQISYGWIKVPVDNNYEKITYDWINLSDKTKKADLREIGNLLIEYAKSNNWKNNYYLYIVFEGAGYGQIIYDYETDTLWLPSCDELNREMFSKFQSFIEKRVAQLPNGFDFLVDNNLAYVKHNELEYNLDTRPYWHIMITDEGTLQDFGTTKYDSTPH